MSFRDKRIINIINLTPKERRNYAKYLPNGTTSIENEFNDKNFELRGGYPIILTDSVLAPETLQEALENPSKYTGEPYEKIKEIGDQISTDRIPTLGIGEFSSTLLRHISTRQSGFNSHEMRTNEGITTYEIQPTGIYLPKGENAITLEEKVQNFIHRCFVGEYEIQ